jgi:hypothetical protein
MWTYSFPYNSCWRNYLLYNVGFWHLCQKSDRRKCVDLFLDLHFYSIDLCMCLFLCWYHAAFFFFYYDSVVKFEVRYCDSSQSIALFAQDCFDYLGVFCTSKWTLGLIYISVKKLQWKFEGDCIESVHCFW